MRLDIDSPLLVGFVFRVKWPELEHGREYTLGNLKDLAVIPASSLVCDLGQDLAGPQSSQ